MENFIIPQNEIDTLETLQELLDYNEITAQEEIGEDEYPFPQVFKFQALAIRTLLSNPEYKFPPIENLKHIFCEEINDEATPELAETINKIDSAMLRVESEINLELPFTYTKYFYIKINGNSAIFYEGCDGNSSTNFSYYGLIL
jgi:hypothetical protein